MHKATSQWLKIGCHQKLVHVINIAIQHTGDYTVVGGLKPTPYSLYLQALGSGISKNAMEIVGANST